MKHLRSILMILAVLVALPLAALAMQHEAGGSGMDHGKMDMDKGKMDMDKGEMEHGGMMMEGNMAMLGDAVEDGVKAMAHLKDVKDAMAKMGMKTTHHLMVMFADADSGKPIDAGMAAVKITGPDGKESEAIKLMGMQGHFGADVALAGPGAYHFSIGTKLPDGKKRQFEFDYHLK